MQSLKRDNKVKTFSIKETSPENEPQKRKPGKYQKLFKEFSQESSAGGINKVFSSKPVLIRTIWVILCVLCYGMMVWLSFQAIEEYLNKPTATFVDVSFQSDLPFPAVTICNLNKFRSSVVRRRLPNVSEVIMDHRKQSWNRKGQGKNDWQSSNQQKQFYLERALGRSGISSPGVDTDSVSSEDILEEMVLDASAQYSQGQLKMAGHSFDNLIVNCRWMGIKCNTGSLRKYWKNIWNWKYGNCYTFNFGTAEDNTTLSLLRTNKAGPNYGLTLDLFIEQHEYIKELSEEAGVKVVIVDAQHHPFPFQEGIAVSPGAATAIALRKEIINRVDRFNNKSCIDDTENMKSIYTEDGSQNVYAIQSCLDTCLVEQQVDECNCSDARYPTDGNVCTNRVQSECLANVETKYKNDEYGCIARCPQGCKSISYRTTISEAQSSSQYAESQRKSLNRTSTFQKYVKTKDDFKNDFLRIKIYFEELNLIRIHQEFSYPLTSLLSDIGGQLGLWVGLSVITFAEVGDLFLSFIMLAFSRD